MKLAALGLGALAAVSGASATTYFEDKFDADPFDAGWTHSEWKKKSDRGVFSWTAGEWNVDADAEKGIMTSEDARFHAIS